MFKRNFEILLIFFLIVLVFSGCEHNNNQIQPRQIKNESAQVHSTNPNNISQPNNLNSHSTSATTMDTDNKIKITFIELGSVNCIPCRMMQPIMEQIEKEYAGKVNVVFYDVLTKDGQPFGQKYGIRAIPTQVFLDENGNEFNRHEGFYPFEEIKKIFAEKGIN